MRQFKILLFFMLFSTVTAQAQHDPIDSLLKQCELKSGAITKKRISAYKKSACFQADFQAINFWEFEFAETIAISEVKDGSWINKIRPSKRGYTQLSSKGAKTKIQPGFSSFFRIADKGKTKVIALMDDDAAGILCNSGYAPALRQDEFIIESMGNGKVDHVIFLPQSISKFIGFKGSKAYIFVFDNPTKAYRAVDFVTYVQEHQQELINDGFHNFKE